jgi:hypothetical protein
VADRNVVHHCFYSNPTHLTIFLFFERKQEGNSPNVLLFRKGKQNLQIYRVNLPDITTSWLLLTLFTKHEQVSILLFPSREGGLYITENVIVTVDPNAPCCQKNNFHETIILKLSSAFIYHLWNWQRDPR